MDGSLAVSLRTWSTLVAIISAFLGGFMLRWIWEEPAEERFVTEWPAVMGFHPAVPADSINMNANVPYNRPINVLFLTTYQSYASHMDRHYYRKYENAKQLPLLNRVHIWGSGFPYYNESRSLRQNLQDVFGSECFFDFIHFFYPFGRQDEIRDMTRVPYCENVKKPGPIFAYWEHEACDRRSSYILKEDGMNMSILMMAYCGEVRSYRSLTESINYPKLAVHMPHSIHVEKYDLAPEHDPFLPGQVNMQGKTRSIDLLLVGRTHRIYPLRSRLFPLLKRNAKELGNVVHVEHPGYSELSGELPGVEDREWQVLHYATLMNDARICVFDATIRSYFVQKFEESTISGCLPLSDMPHTASQDEYEMLSNFILVIDPKDSDQVILSKIQAMLSNEQERLSRIAYGKKAMMDKFDGVRIWQKVLDVYHMARRGESGLVFPFGPCECEKPGGHCANRC